MKIAKSNKSLGLPAEFGAIEERGGKAVIAKDFFFGKRPSCYYHRNGGN